MTAELRYTDEWLSVWLGDARDALRQMPEKSVQTCITSPPFYGLRSYGTAKWEGGDPNCDHDKAASGRGTNVPQTKNPGVDYPIAPHRGGNPNLCVRCGAIRIEPTIWGGDPEHEHDFQDSSYRLQAHGDDGLGGNLEGGKTTQSQTRLDLITAGTCACGAWRGALGLEPTPDAYVAHLVEVFDEVWRVLRDDGILWLNLGDSYANDTKWGGKTGGKHAQALHGDPSIGRGKRTTGLKSKDLIGIPWMAAFALRSAGWYLRQDIVWNKLNPMPESVDDRPTRSHEFIFMLTKESRYFYDGESVKESLSQSMLDAAKRKVEAPGKVYQHDEHSRMGKTSANRVWSDPMAVARILASGRQRRDVWTIASTPYPGAHFATWPTKLVEPMVKASTSEKGCCAECGAPLRRVTVDVGVTTAKGGEPHTKDYGRLTTDGMDDLAGDGLTGSGFPFIERETTGWDRTCNHFDSETVPCVVLDCFAGSGTTALVAQNLGRRAVLIDLNEEYSELQMVRNRDIPLGI